MNSLEIYLSQFWLGTQGHFSEAFPGRNFGGHHSFQTCFRNIAPARKVSFTEKKLDPFVAFLFLFFRLEASHL